MGERSVITIGLEGFVLMLRDDHRTFAKIITAGKKPADDNFDLNVPPGYVAKKAIRQLGLLM